MINFNFIIVFVAFIFIFPSRAIYDCIYQLELCYLLFQFTKYDVWHWLAQFPVAHVTMLQFQLTIKLIIDGSGLKKRNDWNTDKYEFKAVLKHRYFSLEENFIFSVSYFRVKSNFAFVQK